ncbi:MAG: UvrD-helicase domain-containing protein [Treponema sp.]|jgi:ATP-dependent helicase/nuclease subunit A|nr:UvrD-helicase domain-containing protein [Treponema sp.]
MAEQSPLKKLNPEQERAACWEENAVVAAGAGSGKTSVLASRYLWLVTEKGCKVEQILTLTFTRKAAAEMYQRIHAALAAEAQAAEALPAPDGAGQTRRERIRAALDGFFHARIQTLDSYSAYIVKQAATRYGIRPDFTVDEDRCRQLAEEEALPFLISRRNHPALERLYRTKKPADIGRDLFAGPAFKYSRIDEPPSYAGETLKRFEGIRAEWAETRPLILSLLGELAALAEEGGGKDKFLDSILPLTEKFRSDPGFFPGPEEFRDYFAALAAAPEGERVNLAETLPLRGRLIRCLDLLCKICRANMQIGRRGSRAKELCGELRARLREFSSLLVFCVQAGLILSLTALLDEFQQGYLDKKRAEGVLDFADIARLARTILRDHPDIRYNEKTAFKAIMIDEFQDNNSLQKELLFLLAEKTERADREIPPATEILPGKLFFVGDEKQSIYRFRGADVSVFRQLKTELAAEDLTLRINYRSSPDLIAAFNGIFQAGGVFLPGGKPPYEADYSPLAAHRSGPGSIGIYILNRNAGDDDGEEEEEGEAFEADENEAVFAAEKIRDLLAETAEDGKPSYRPEDIAILFRTRGPQRVFEKHLRLLGIPYAGEGLSGFFADGPVNDLAALLRLVSYPLDTEAYAVCLRSPFAGLSLAALAICLSEFEAAREAGLSPVPFSGAVLPLLEGSDRRAYEQGGELYRRVREKAAFLSSGELVSELWYREGYRYETEWNPQTSAYRELFDYLYSQALKADGENLSLAAFSDRLMALREKEERIQDTELPLERPGAVRLLTIHKSKGLEFPVVFIAGCGRKARGNTNDEEIYASGDGGLSFNPPLPPECSRMNGLGRNFFYERDRLEEKRMAAAELRRLLYVAMTRAEDRLIITGAYSLGTEGEDTASLLDRAVSRKRKAQAEKDRKAGLRRLPEDPSLDDGTLFGLLLPALADRWFGEGKSPPPFLSLEAIPPYTGEDIRRREGGGAYPNDREGLSRFLAAAAPYYRDAEIITTPRPAKDHLSPSSFHTALPEGGKGETGNPAFNGEGGAEPFARADRIVARLAARSGRRSAGEGAGEAGSGGEGFGPAEFGTLAHLCVEALLKGAEPLIPPRLAGFLSPGEGESLLSAGKELAERFLRSPLGKAAAESSFCRSEYPFRSFYPGGTPEGGADKNPENPGMYIGGTIDLLFEREDQVWVVDFKTDLTENPREHLPQMAFYYRAARDLRKKKCRIWIYYFRTGHAVELDGI